jgi:hypothetical protein
VTFLSNSDFSPTTCAAARRDIAAAARRLSPHRLVPGACRGLQPVVWIAMVKTSIFSAISLLKVVFLSNTPKN